MSNLYEANAQWANRPEDERFGSLNEMKLATKAHADSAMIAGDIPLESLGVEVVNSDLALVGSTGAKAKLTHYSFGQLARIAKAPPDYVRSLTPELAADCVNYGLAQAPSKEMSLLFHKNNGKLVTRAINTSRYDRVWNHEVIGAVEQRLEDWQVPPARPAFVGQKGTRKATAADILKNQKEFGLAVKVGDLIAPAGLYASDHDMFAFLVNQTDPVWDGVKFLNRGVFIQNSEVGDCALKFTLFTYDNVCGNHIVWGAGNVRKVSVRHLKGLQTPGHTLESGFGHWQVVAKNLPDGDSVAKQITKARAFLIADSKENVIETVFKFGKTRGLNRLSRGTLEAGYEAAEASPRYGSPNSAWGFVNGLTEVSQGAFTDVRNELDVQAGRILEMVN